MSFSREGYKSQKLLAQVCRQCLSKRTVVTPPVYMRRHVNTSTVPANDTPGLLEKFRTELLTHPPKVKKVILRRHSRQRLLTMYQAIKQHPIVTQLDRQDFTLFISKFLTNPDDPKSNGPTMEAFDIIQELKAADYFEFTREDYELAIYLATELKLSKKATDLLSEATCQFSMNAVSYEAVIALLSAQRKQKLMDVWITKFTLLGLNPTKAMVRSVVLANLAASDGLDQAAAYIRQHPSNELADLAVKYPDSRDLMDAALDVFAMDCLKDWRLNEMMTIYIAKRQLGLSTRVIVKHLVNKCLYTGQLHTAEKLLADSILMQDTSNAKYISAKLIHWYLVQKNIKAAMHTWQDMENNQYVLDEPLFEDLLIQSAKLKYHVDVMKLYKRYNTLYPKKNHRVAAHVLRCMARSSDYQNAARVQQDVEPMLDSMKPELARIVVTSLFSLSAQTGDIQLFERIFAKSEELKLSLTHKGLSSLTASYLTRGDVQSAKLAFQKVVQHTNGPDVVDFNLLMRTVVMEDQGVDYEKIFDILKHMDLVNVLPNETTMRTMCGFYKSDSEMQNSLYTKLLQNPSSISRFNQVYLNNIALSSLLSRMDLPHVVGILCRNNRSELFKTEVGPIHVNGDTYKMLLDAANKHRKYSSIAEKLLRDMEARGMKPIREVYESLIARVAQKGKIAKARRYIDKMETDTGEKADVATYTKLVDGFMYLNKPHLAKLIITHDMVQKNLAYDEIVHAKLKKIDEALLKTSHNKK